MGAGPATFEVRSQPESNASVENLVRLGSRWDASWCWSFYQSSTISCASLWMRKVLRPCAGQWTLHQAGFTVVASSFASLATTSHPASLRAVSRRMCQALSLHQSVETTQWAVSTAGSAAAGSTDVKTDKTPHYAFKTPKFSLRAH